MPALTLRAMAELMTQPAYQYLRVVQGQKYPRAEPQVYKIPYYAKALHGIRRYYRSGNDRGVLAAARRTIELSVSQKAKRDHNLRVLRSFARGRQSRRVLRLLPKQRLIWSSAGVHIKLNFDVAACEGTREVRLL